MTLFQIYMMTHSHNCCGHKKTDMKFTNMRYVQWSNHSLIEKKNEIDQLLLLSCPEALIS